MEGNSGDVASMTLKRQQRVGIGRLDIVELDGMVAGGCKEAFVGGYAEAVNLRVGVLDRTRTDSGESLPEPKERAINKLAFGPQHKTPEREGGLRATCRRIPDRVIITGCDAN